MLAFHAPADGDRVLKVLCSNGVWVCIYVARMELLFGGSWRVCIASAFNYPQLLSTTFKYSQVVTSQCFAQQIPISLEGYVRLKVGQTTRH